MQSAPLEARIDPAYWHTARAAVLVGPLSPRVLAGQLTAPVTPVASLDAALAAAVRAAVAAGDRDSACAGLQVRLYRFAPRRHLLLLVLHPALGGAATLAAWYRGLAARLAGRSEPADPAEPARVSEDDRAVDWAYWLTELGGELPVVDLTGAGATPGGWYGVSRPVESDSALAVRLRALADAHAAPVEAVVLAGLALLVCRYTGLTDVLIGLPLASDRRPGGPEELAVVRLDAGTGSSATLIARATRALRDARRHPVPPFETLVRRLGTRADPARWPVFQVSATFDTLVLPDPAGADAAAFALGLPGAGSADADSPAPAPTLWPIALPHRRLPGELAVTVTVEPLRIAVTLPEGSPASFPAAVGADLATVLAELAGGVSADQVLAEPRAGRPPAAVRPSRLHTRATGHVPFDAWSTASSLAERFAAVAARHGDRVAVLADDGARTYRELARSAGGIAQAVRPAGTGPGRVGLLLDHGAGMVAAILGTLAAGGSYVPLDPAYPPDRLAAMLAAADVGTVLTQRAHLDLAREVVGAGGTEIRFVDGCEPADLVPVVPVPPDAPAYVLFTSGSTGMPKGVGQTHRNVLHGIRNHVENLRIGPDDRVGLLTSFCFDMAVTDLFAAILSGAAVVPIDVRTRGLTHLVTALADHEVSIYHSTPTLYRHLCQALGTRRLPAVRAVVLGGEGVTRSDVRQCRERFGTDAVFVNGYGTTEASFAVQYHVAGTSDGEEADRTVVPIGYPLPGYEIVLLDGHGRPVALTGEITIRSRYVAPGYWRAPAATSERFTEEPGGLRSYRTGDLGRRLPDGRLVYLGRLDRQVKVRGYRVELGEIEAHLGALAGVGRAVAVARPDHVGATEVIAYVEPALGVAAPDPAALRRALAGLLPDHLVPRLITVVARLPLTPTGKVDMRALPEPRATGGDDPPRTATERLVADLWCAVLGRSSVGVFDNFFELGGHSLLLAQVQAGLEEATGVRAPLLYLFNHPTVAATAAYLAAPEGSAAGSAAGTDPALAAVARRMARRRAVLTVRPSGPPAGGPAEGAADAR